MQRTTGAAVLAMGVMLGSIPALAEQNSSDAHFKRDHQGQGGHQAPSEQQESKPKIDVVFLLDTTGSMANLIQGAKVKIWSIAKEMLDARVTPDLRMGLIGYRDRGDAYVTKSFDLTDDIDRIYGELLMFEADGGGDTPEAVNQALDDAVNDLSWDRGRSVYRVVFLVGDAPPKMNYNDDVKYHVTAQRAAQQDIVINTVLAGSARDTAKVWREIARLAQGRFAAIPQSGNMQIIETPYDQDIQSLNQRLNRTALPYGGRAQQDEVRQKLERSASAPSSVVADKSAYQKTKGVAEEIVTGEGELINDLAAGRVTLDALDPDDLPAALRDLSPEQQRAAIAEQTKLRDGLRQKINALVAKRADYIQREQENRGESDSFDGEVGAMIREQGAAKGIAY